MATAKLPPKLSADEARAAALLGWQLCDVYESNTKAWKIRPFLISTPPSNSEVAFALIRKQAQERNPLALKALQAIVMTSK